jgi:hypothetical protein
MFWIKFITAGMVQSWDKFVSSTYAVNLAYDQYEEWRLYDEIAQKQFKCGNWHLLMQVFER